MDLITINLEDELFNNLCGGFQSMTQREPTAEETEEIYTGVELGMTDISTRTTQRAGLYKYEDDYFLVHLTTIDGAKELMISLLNSFVYAVPLFVAAKPSDAFWLHFEQLFYEVYS